MNSVRLGRTEIVTPKNGFGALPIQRISDDEAVKIVRRAFESGITYFDTARGYTDSEHKLGLALSDVRDKVFIATKTMATDGEGLRRDLETSLRELNTDYIDLYQFHNPAVCPKPGDGSGLYEAALEAKAQGIIRHIGITNHRLAVAHEAIESGLFETLQFPFCYLATDKDIEIALKCKAADMGFIAMKSMSGGLITRSDAAYAFADLYDNVLPIWGVQKMSELEEFIALGENPPVMTDEMKAFIESEKNELSGDFCRGCGYCMPCPVGIKINDCARMSLMIRRAPVDIYMDKAHQEDMEKIEDCIECRRCASKCPYGLDTPALLKKNLIDYREQVKLLGK